MIYLDNAATTKVFDCAIEAMEQTMKDCFFNPNATYKRAIDAKKGIDSARKTIADCLKVRADEIVFTSCATESNNWVMNCGRKRPKGNVVISAGEHSSVYEPAMQLKNRGIDVRIVPLLKSGIIDEGAFSRAVDENTTFVSIIHVNNETGAINPIKRLVDTTKRLAPNALFHSDGVQGALKTKDTISSLGVDFYSASAHKLGAPKGIGFLYIKNGINIAPMLYGGGQEDGKRSGTQNTPYIAAFAAAVEHLAAIDKSHVLPLRNELAEHFKSHGCTVIGDDNNSGYILGVVIPGVKAEILQNAVCDRDVIIGKGAACSGAKRGNRVLSAIGLTDKQIECYVRLSFAADTYRDEAMKAAQIITETAQKIRSENV
ncbi:MAG: cysteine desulfurase [Clostridiales bacterium]|nr:cysteine desulfurase [Clostridiales bacterium]